LLNIHAMEANPETEWKKNSESNGDHDNNWDEENDVKDDHVVEGYVVEERVVVWVLFQECEVAQDKDPEAEARV